ncbi:hypothetical protein HHK36_005310 [Tetracentron sinense]|uniref:Uncharacterized protein n=1 Tax=Tetracentron sinense TaxID=13715 RepID=A0A834ZTX6_TETSI|nr:hypothetical protein HHK36_005310 [Tetracentron sinense]
MGVRRKPWFNLPALLLYFLSFNTHFSIGADTIFPGQSLSGNQTIISKGGIFELGFFLPGNNSQNYYIGIWYKSIPVQTKVWVANRDKPLPDPFSSALKLSADGNLVLLNKSKVQIWSTNSTSHTSNSTVAVLLDSGNLILRERDSSKIIWQSFDHPTDTWLPGGKLGFNKLTHERQFLTSWRTSEDPAPGIFSVGVDPNQTSHSLLWNGSQRYWTSGNWTGRIFSLVPEIVKNYYIDNFTYVSNENESYFTYYASSIPALSRFVLNATGQIQEFTWGKNFKEWGLFWARPTEQCEVYAFCGAYGICNQRSMPLCQCIKGFEPRFSKDWNLGYHSGGCVRKTPLQCISGGNDSFLVMPNMRLKEDSESLIVGNAEECELACLSNCSCTAYAYDYDEGCLIWQGDLLNQQQLYDDTGLDLYVRVEVSEGKTKRLSTKVIMGAVAGVVILIGIVGAVIWRCRTRQFADALEAAEDSLVVFKHRELRSATNNFSEKLGEGDGMDDYFPSRVVNKINRGEEVLSSLLDYKLEGNADMEELSRACRVACWCIQDDDKDRPSMGHVVQILEGVLEMDTPPIPRFIQQIAENPVGDQVFAEASVNVSLGAWVHNTTASQAKSSSTIT